MKIVLEASYSTFDKSSTLGKLIMKKHDFKYFVIDEDEYAPELNSSLDLLRSNHSFHTDAIEVY